VPKPNLSLTFGPSPAGLRSSGRRALADFERSSRAKRILRPESGHPTLGEKIGRLPRLRQESGGSENVRISGVTKVESPSPVNHITHRVIKRYSDEIHSRRRDCLLAVGQSSGDGGGYSQGTGTLQNKARPEPSSKAASRATRPSTIFCAPKPDSRLW
jgi:hypothetical protein